jgi:hypothetical protein
MKKWYFLIYLLALSVCSFMVFQGSFVINTLVINRIVSDPPYYFVVINGAINSEGAELKVFSHRIKIKKIFPSSVVLQIDDKSEKDVEITKPDMRIFLF